VSSSSGRTWPPTVMRRLPRSTSSSCIVRIIFGRAARTAARAIGGHGSGSWGCGRSGRGQQHSVLASGRDDIAWRHFLQAPLRLPSSFSRSRAAAVRGCAPGSWFKAGRVIRAG
jgi:anti-sigma factor RsiW